MIFAAKMNVPFVGLVYDPKVSSFIKKMDMGPYMSDISNVGVEDLLRKIDEVYKNKESIRSIIRENMERIEMEAKEQLGLITVEIERSG